jgi:hypothetical protein
MYSHLIYQSLIILMSNNVIMKKTLRLKSKGYYCLYDKILSIVKAMNFFFFFFFDGKVNIFQKYQKLSTF